MWLDPNDITAHEVIGSTAEHHPVLRVSLNDGSYADVLDLYGVFRN